MAKKTRKKTTRSRKTKSKPRKSATKPRIKVTSDGIGVGASRPAGSVKYIGSGRRGTKYQAVIEAIKGLKKGESFPITPPAGVTAAVLHSRLAVILKRSIESGEIVPPEGYKIRKRTVADTGQIEISLLPIKAG